MAGVGDLQAARDLVYSERFVKIVDYGELERMIAKIYGVFESGYRFPGGYLRFSIVAMEEWGNDQMHRFTVKKEPLTKWDLRGLDEFMKNPYTTQYCLGTIMTDMCNNGHLQPGEYIIDVSW